MGTAVKKNAAALLCAAILIFASANAAALGDRLVPVGKAVGITMEIDGALVCGLREVETTRGKASPAEESGIRPGDVITGINGRRVSSSEELMKALEECAGAEIEAAVVRRGNVTELKLKPAENGDGALELGILVRDRISGIGTVTWYDPETGEYGALGHSVSDPETGCALPLRAGSISPIEISSVKAGAGGKPGELVGSISDADRTGSIMRNSDCGIFGTVCEQTFEGEVVQTASPGDIRTGKAELLATVDGTETERYEIEITKIFGRGSGRDMLVEVTDERLIGKTGGIVQGMSGCPVIQNGRLVGAVTHVLVNEPTKGYAISIERMLAAA